MNQIIRFYFQDPNDIALINRLLSEQNEFVLSCIDVYESDRDQENLVENLVRIVNKSRQMGVNSSEQLTHNFFH